MAGLGELERAVMDSLWDSAQPLTAGEVRSRVSSPVGAGPGGRGRELALTTVMTVLSRLEKKGFVERSRSQRPQRYGAVSSRADHTATLMHEVLGSAPDREAALARFVGAASPTETATLRRLLDSLPRR